MIRPSIATFLSSLLLGLVVGCGQAPPPPGIGDDDDTPYVQPGPWEDMDFAQRLEYMEEVVQPTMEDLFVTTMPEVYDELPCESCHGEDPSDVDYEMPNGLEPLDLDDFPLDQSDDPEIAAIAAFMNDEVKPVMAELLGEQPFPQGTFGCFECHEQE